MAREYKDSGIEWIGLIPKEWKVVPLKWILRNPLQYGANENGKSFDKSLPRYIRITDILNNNLREDIQKQSLTEKQAVGYILEDNDILFARSGGTVGKAFIYKSKYGRSAFAGYLIRAQINKENNPWYVHYFTQSSAYEEWKKKIFIQATIQNIGADRYSLLEIPLPPLPEQEKIADYLDKVCGEVDEMIALQEKMIEELKAYKQSIITEAVTKGLNPNVPMKNSGIDWIGEIPEHWKTTKIKKIATTNSGSTPRKISNSEGSNIVWIRTTDINDNIVYDSSLHLTNEEFSSASCPMLKSGTCVVAMYGGGGTIGKSGILGVTATINQALCSMEVNDSYFAQYLFCVLKSVRYYWMKYAVGTRKDPNINQEIVRNLNIPFPLIEEQRQIASFLDTKCSEIDSLIAIKQQKIAELKEYKKSVIYEYVTGKKEVV